MATRSFLQNSSARALVAGDLQAVFLPDHGMLGASLRYRGVEILRRVEDLEAAAATLTLHVAPATELLAGYRYAQVFAPKDKDDVALEPMTAPTSALTSGRGLRFVPPRERFRAAFRIRIDRP